MFRLPSLCLLALCAFVATSAVAADTPGLKVLTVNNGVNQLTLLGEPLWRPTAAARRSS